MGKETTRLNVVLVKNTNKRLAEKVNEEPCTISKWCSNTIQSNLKALIQITLNLEVQLGGITTYTYQK